jgi:hypothetical protein
VCCNCAAIQLAAEPRFASLVLARSHRTPAVLHSLYLSCTGAGPE